MSKTTFEHKFNIGEMVYHIFGESRKGLITDITYSKRFNDLRYRVVFGVFDGEEVLCLEDELTENVNYN